LIPIEVTFRKQLQNPKPRAPQNQIPKSFECVFEPAEPQLHERQTYEPLEFALDLTRPNLRKTHISSTDSTA